MNEPQDPGWDFPEVEPVPPTSTELPAEDDAPVSSLEELAAAAGAYDTGSDAWWRAQAAAQRAAASTEPAVSPTPPPPVAPVEPPPLVEPTVLLPEPPPLWTPTPVLDDWALPAPTGPPVQAGAPVEPGPPLSVPVEAVVAPVVESAPEPVVEAPVPDPYETTELPPYTPASFEALRAPEPQEPEPAPVGPRRALLGAGLAVAGVALGIGALLLLNDDKPAGTPTVALPTHAPTPSAAPSAKPTPSLAPTTPGATSAPPVVVAAPVVPVTVLNNSRVSGLAKTAAARFKTGGWPVPKTGNYSGGTISQTTVYYAAGQLASAQRFAAQFHIGRVLPRFAGLPGHGMTVVVTRDYA